MAGLVGTVGVPTSGFWDIQLSCTSVGLTVSLVSLVQLQQRSNANCALERWWKFHLKRWMSTGGYRLPALGQPRPPTSLYRACPGPTEVPSEATWDRGLLIDTPCMYSLGMS